MEHGSDETDAEGRFSADFEALFHASPTPLLALAPPDWIIVAANDARLLATGATREQQIGRPLFEVFPDNPADGSGTGETNLSNSLERVLATGAPDTMAVQRYPVRDGSGQFVERWWCPINVPVLAKDGAVAMVFHRVEEVTEVVQLRGSVEIRDRLVREQKTIIDRLRYTEASLRQRERHLQLMVNELNHRVKNNLAIVQSMVTQSLRGVGSPETSDTIERRLVALAKAHDAITVEHWSGADLRKILAHVQGAFVPENDRVELVGSDVKLPPRLAVALALIFHELATNAVRYGSLSVRGGRVIVEWKVAHEAEGDRLQLEWREEGGPAVGHPVRRGFGTRMIERGGSGIVAGTQMIFEPQGLICRLAADVTPDEAPAFSI